MKIPQQIQIEIVNQNDENLALEIVFGLKIFINNGSYYNYSMIKTFANGKKLILQEEIINSTELKYLENLSNFEFEKIEFYVWDCDSMNNLINYLNYTENNLNKDNARELYVNELIERGFTRADAEKYSVGTVEKLRSDLKMLSDFKGCKNCETQFIIESINDIWEDDSTKTYKFVAI